MILGNKNCIFTRSTPKRGLEKVADGVFAQSGARGALLDTDRHADIAADAGPLASELSICVTSMEIDVNDGRDLHRQ